MEIKKSNNRVTNVKDSDKHSSDKRRRLMPKILSLLAAFCIWFYVVSVESPVVEKTFADIPVKIILPEEGGFKAYSGLGQTVNITVKGKKSDIRILSSDDFEAVMDMTNYKQAETYNVEVDIITPSSVTVVEQSKKEIEVFLDTEEHEIFSVEVEPVGGSWDANVTIDKISEPSKIEIKGPGTILNTIERAVVLFDWEGNIETEKYADHLNIELRDENDNPVTSKYIKTSDNEAHVTIRPIVTRDISLGLSVASLEADDYTYTLEPANIAVKGVVGDIEKNDPYVIECDINDFKTFGVPVTLPLVFDPAITPEDPDIKEITATVELNYEEKTFEDVPLTIDAPGTMKYTVKDSMDITLSCIPSRINDIKKKDIKLTADLSELKEKSGVFKVPVKVQLPEELEKVVSLGEYSISVEITEG